MRRKIFLGMASALLLLLVLLMSWSDPEPRQEQVPAVGGRELDEAAEEVRAVATAIRRLEEKIADQKEWNQTLQEDIFLLSQRLEELDRPAKQLPAQEEISEPSAQQEPSPLDLDSLVNQGQSFFSEDSAETERAVAWIEPIPGRRPGTAGIVAVPSVTAEEPPRFMIPPAFLAGRSLTALVGRVPRGGSVQDPWPFLAISGADNWTANEVQLPHLRGILWRGVASGDAVLSCVRASIRSLVYVFEDGVFHEARSSESEDFGYLADPYGNPCLQGTLYSTANENLGRNLFASLVAGVGSVAAKEQIESRIEGGVEVQTLEGDPLDLLLGQSVEGAARAYSDLLTRYSSDAWDAIVVPAGQEVDIHLTTSIPISYRSSQRIHDETLVPVLPVSHGGLD